MNSIFTEEKAPKATSIGTSAVTSTGTSNTKTKLPKAATTTTTKPKKQNPKPRPTKKQTSKPLKMVPSKAKCTTAYDDESIKELFNELERKFNVKIQNTHTIKKTADVSAVSDHYMNMIHEISRWKALKFLVLTDLNGVIGYRKKGQKNQKLVKRPNLDFYLDHLTDLQNPERGVYSMVYSSAAAKNLKPILENNDLSVLSDRPLVFFDQVFCFIRKLNIGNISPKIGEKDIEGIKDFLNGFLEEKHKEIIHALCSDSSSALSSQGGKPEASCHGLNTPASHELQTNFYRVCELINTIAVIQSLFMMKGSKNLDTIVGFVCAVRSLGPNEDSNNYQCNIQSILLDDEIALKLPKNQQLDGFQVTTFDEQSQKSFDVKKDDMDLNEIFNEIDERILAFFLAFSDPSHLVENFTFPEVELEEFEDSSLDDDVFYDKDYQDQIGGNLEITELPSEIKENIDFILPNLSESTQNVIHFLNLRLKNAKGRGSQSNAYEALSNRWLQYALFTKDQTKKSRASQIAEWYKERAEALD